MKQHTEFVVIAPTILDLRKKEMTNVRVPVMGDEVDLRYLWLTAYGFQILSALKMNLYTNQEGLLKIREALHKLGYDLSTTEAQRVSSPVRMSRKLKNCIWEHARLMA